MRTGRQERTPKQLIEKDFPKDTERLESFFPGAITGLAAQGARVSDPVRKTLSLFGDKWTPLVVSVLSGGPMRYMSLLRVVSARCQQKGECGISQRMLTLTLRGLEHDNFATRKVWPTIPPQVEYSLTPLGESLYGQILAIERWAQSNATEIAKPKQPATNSSAAPTFA